MAPSFLRLLRGDGVRCAAGRGYPVWQPPAHPAVCVPLKGRTPSPWSLPAPWPQAHSRGSSLEPGHSVWQAMPLGKDLPTEQ